jgi:hypothetical protein
MKNVFFFLTAMACLSSFSLSSQNVVWQQEAIDSSGLKQYPIVFSRYGEGTHPVINGSTAPGGDHLCAILINNQDGIKLQSLEVTNDRRVSREGENETWCRVKKNILKTC